MTRQHKQFQPDEMKILDEDAGSFVATFSRFNVIDHDGDVTLPGAFKDGQEVKIAQWGHNWSAVPVGKGTIHSDDEKAWVAGEFFLDTASGKETYTVVKRLGGLQEWSYGFEVKEHSNGEFDGQQVQFLRSLDVFEVSPVMIGAGIGTQTDAIKQHLDDILTKRGRPLQDHREAVLDAVPDLVGRYEALAASEVKAGRALSEARCQQMATLAETFEENAKTLRALLDENEPEADDEKQQRIQEFRKQHALLMAQEAGIDMTGEHDAERG